MKLRNLFVYHSTMCGVRLMRILNLDHYVAFMGRKIGDRTKVYWLTEEECRKLEKRRLWSAQLRLKRFRWERLDRLEQRFTEKELDDYIDSAVRKGMPTTNCVC